MTKKYICHIIFTMGYIIPLQEKLVSMKERIRQHQQRCQLTNEKKESFIS